MYSNLPKPAQIVISAAVLGLVVIVATRVVTKVAAKVPV